MDKSPLLYADSGVDIDAGNRLVDRIKEPAAATKRPGVMEGLGGFGALFDLKACGFRDPILVSGTDGVGTKLKIAIETDRLETLGQDLVAMCVNDILVQGAEPLFFLDYFATGHLDVSRAARVIDGIARACREAGCALVGGETAEMPGLYQRGDFDLAGFCVGAVERDRLITGKNIRAGDILLGLPSSGLHSNGYSLVRKAVEREGLAYEDICPYNDTVTLGADIMTPTRLYPAALKSVLDTGQIKGLVHVTGGGLIDNIPRILPAGVDVELVSGSWPVPPVFRWLADITRAGNVEMARTFNCGLGMILFVAPDLAAQIGAILRDQQEDFFDIGRVVPHKGEAEVRVHGLAELF